jgi:hypothetical protein
MSNTDYVLFFIVLENLPENWVKPQLRIQRFINLDIDISKDWCQIFKNFELEHQFLIKVLKENAKFTQALQTWSILHFGVFYVD